MVGTGGRKVATTGAAPAEAEAAGVVVVCLREFDLLRAWIGDDRARWLRNLAAKRLRDVVAGRGSVRRIGDEEFAVLDLPPGAAAAVAADLAQALRAPFHRDGRNHYLRISVGTAEDTTPAASVLADARLACRSAAVSEIRAYAPALRSVHVREMAMEMALRDAILSRSDDFHMAYQPIFDLRDRRLVGYEALARWNSRELGEISPASFVPVAEKAGLAAALGERVCELAAETAEQLNRTRAAAGAAPVFMSINVSALQVADPDLVTVLGGILAKAGGDPGNIRFELTESVLLAGKDSAVLVIERLRALGPAVTLDDFGTGYSSFSYLHELPVDGIKLGRSFIQQIPESGRATEVVGALVRLAHELGLSVVAEGVETESTWQVLRRFGCDYVQGNLFGSPMARDRILDPGGVGFPELG